MSNKYEATFHPSDGPADQGAREALGEQLAEAIHAAQAEATREVCEPEDFANEARAVLPIIDVQIEAAVSVARAELAEFRDGVAALAEVFERQWLVAEPGTRLHDAFGVRYQVANHLRALLVPSPAEGTGETACELEVIGRLDGMAQWCATHHFWMTPRGCPAVVTPNAEDGAS